MSEKFLVLSEVGNSDPSVYIVTEELTDDDDQAEYMIENHRCPSDMLGVQAVLTDGDCDPHGIITFVQRVPVPADWPWTGTIDWTRYRRLFDKLPADTSCESKTVFVFPPPQARPDHEADGAHHDER